MFGRSTGVTLLALALAGSAAGCRDGARPEADPPTSPARAVAARPSGGAEPASAAREVAAEVNGQPVYLDQVHALLLAGGGLEVAHQLIATAVVEQAAQRQDVRVTEADIQREHVLAMEQLGPNLGRAEQQRMLVALMEQRGISQRMWDHIMRRNAFLRRLAEPTVRITDEMLQQEFNRRYGERVQVRHIQVNSLSDAQQVIDLLKGGADFIELARRVSTNAQSAADGGLFAPFSRQTAEVPPAFRTVAFGLQPGQVSDVVQVDAHFHILRLERVIASENIVFDDVKESLRAQLRDSLLRQLQVAMLQDLIRQADMHFVNPTLKEQARTVRPGGILP